MKKKLTIILKAGFVGIFTMAIFLPLLSAQAATATFNTDPKDYPTLQISNYTQHPGCTSCWSTSVSANPGDVISFLVYYHNTSDVTASQTHASVNLPTGNFTSQTINGTIFSSNANSANGNVSLNISSGNSQTLAFLPGTVKWFANHDSSNSTGLLNGQNGSEIVSFSGLNIGDIAPGWSAQGYIVFRAQLSSQSQSAQNQAPAILNQFVTNISQNSASLNGSVNPNGSNTTVWFEYGTSPSLGSTIGFQNIGSGNSAFNITSFLSGLNSGQTYYFRAVAQNSFGTTYGNVISFTTQTGAINGVAPIVTTNLATNITQNSAVLNGTVNSNNSETNVWFEYGPTGSLGFTTASQDAGSGNFAVNIASFLSSLNTNTTYYFRIVAQNSFGTTYGSIVSFNTSQFGTGFISSAPTVNTDAATNITSNSATLNGDVNSNGSVASMWFEYGPTQNLGYTSGFQQINGFMNVNTFISNLTPNAVYYYRAVAQNSFGTNYGSILTFTTGSGAVISAGGQAPMVTTLPASIVYQNSTVLNGAVITNNLFTNAWFEWGATPSFGFETTVQPAGHDSLSVPLSFALSGLNSNTTYYFRAVAQNAAGTSYGSMLTFTTKSPAYAIPSTGIAVYTPPAAPGITVSLTPSVDNNNPNAGDEMTYTVVYKNSGNRAVSNAVLQIALPNEVSYESADIQPSSQENNNLKFMIGTVAANSQSAVNMKVKVNNSAKGGDSLVFTSIMNYSDYRGRFQAVSSYLTIIVAGGPSISASILGTIGTLFGNWLFDLLLGLLIGFGIYHFFVREKETELV